MGFKQLMQSFLFEEVEPDPNEEEKVQESRPLKAEAAPAETAPAAKPALQHSTPEAEPVNHAVDTDVRGHAGTMQTAVSAAAPARGEHPVQPAGKPAGSDSFFAQMSDVIGPTALEEPKEKEASRRPSRAAARRNPNAANIGYTAVMSPIFGNLPDDQKDHGAVHNAIELPQPHDDAELIRVISPMYGSELPKKTHTPIITPEPVKQEEAEKTARDTHSHQAAPENPKTAVKAAAPAAEETPAKDEKASSHEKMSRNCLETAAALTGEISASSSKGSMNLADFLSRPAAGPKSVSANQKSGGSK